MGSQNCKHLNFLLYTGKYFISESPIYSDISFSSPQPLPYMLRSASAA